MLVVVLVAIISTINALKEELVKNVCVCKKEKLKFHVTLRGIRLMQNLKGMKSSGLFDG